MSGPTLDELRDLSLRSRREQRLGGVAMLGSLLFFPVVGLALAFAPGYAWHAVYAAAAGAGALFVLYSRSAGQTRGAFRRTFKRIKDDAKARTLVPDGPSALSLRPK